MALGIVQTGLQSLIDGWRNGALVGRQQRVAAAAGQAVSVAHNVALHNLNRQVQVLHHRLDNGYLLPVLLAEVGALGLDNIEQTAHHLADTVEVAGPMGTLHHRRDGRILEMTLVGRGVHLLDRGRQHVVGTARLQQPAVGLQRARIVLQIVLVVKLRGIHKYRYDRDAVFLHTATYQRGMTLVKCSHGGY